MSVALPGDGGLLRLIDESRILVCAGSGGVGKTTTAASLALWGALRGRRAIVLTIDPARRLADSLGVGPIGNEPCAVPAELLGADTTGSLAAMMLDQQGSWDDLIARHAPSEAVREQILANPFYQQLAESFAGSQEYMAVEQLGALEASGEYDLIVVDTPPTQHALDFLDAPDRLLAFLDKDIVRWFLPGVSTGWSAFQSMNRSVRFVLDKIEEATGVGVLSQVSDFFSNMGELFDGFEERVARVTALLRAEDTAFVLVAGPDEQVLGQAEYLHKAMAEKEMPLRGVVMNRVHEMPRVMASVAAGEAASAATTAGNEPEPGEPAEAFWSDWAAAADALSGERRAGFDNLRANRAGWAARARGDALRIELFRTLLPADVPVVCIPELVEDIHDIAALGSLHAFFSGENSR